MIEACAAGRGVMFSWDAMTTRAYVSPPAGACTVKLLTCGVVEVPKKKSVMFWPTTPPLRMVSWNGRFMVDAKPAGVEEMAIHSEYTPSANWFAQFELILNWKEEPGRVVAVPVVLRREISVQVTGQLLLLLAAGSV